MKDVLCSLDVNIEGEMKGLDTPDRDIGIDVNQTGQYIADIWHAIRYQSKKCPIAALATLPIYLSRSRHAYNQHMGPSLCHMCFKS